MILMAIFIGDRQTGSPHLAGLKLDRHRDGAWPETVCSVRLEKRASTSKADAESRESACKATTKHEQIRSVWKGHMGQSLC